MTSINQTESDLIKLLYNCIDELSKENAITPHYERISMYIKDIKTIEIDTSEKRVRKAKFFLNKQIYEETIERNGPTSSFYTPEFMDKLNSIWNFSRAGQSFVTSTHSQSEINNIDTKK